MAETSLKKLASDMLLLSDEYERRARLAPGLFVVVPIAVYAYATAETLPLYQSVGLAVLVETMLALFFGHIARAMGIGAQAALFPAGLPTHAWLRTDSPRSVQQRLQWRDALRDFTGLDVYQSDEPAEQDKDIEDAISQARVRLRQVDSQPLLQTHNQEYGFARNLYGLTPIWLAASAVTSVAAGVTLLQRTSDWLTFSVEVTFLVAAVAFRLLGPKYVTWTADRYAESFFTAVVLVTERDKANPSA